MVSGLAPLQLCFRHISVHSSGEGKQPDTFKPTNNIHLPKADHLMCSLNVIVVIVEFACTLKKTEGRFYILQYELCLLIKKIKEKRENQGTLLKLLLYAIFSFVTNSETIANYSGERGTRCCSFPRTSTVESFKAVVSL